MALKSKKEKHSVELIAITEEESDTMNGLFNGLIHFLEGAGDGDLDEMLKSFGKVKEIILSESFLDIHNKLNKARHEAGFCKDPNCKSKTPLRTFN